MVSVETEFSAESIALIYKDNYYWIATGRRFLGNKTCYMIDRKLEFNGFENPTDAYAYLLTVTKQIVKKGKGEQDGSV